MNKLVMVRQNMLGSCVLLMLLMEVLTPHFSW